MGRKLFKFSFVICVKVFPDVINDTGNSLDKGWKLLTIFAESAILDVWRSSEYASDIDYLTIASLQFWMNETSVKDFLDLFWETYKMTFENNCGCRTPPLSVQTISWRTIMHSCDLSYLVVNISESLYWLEILRVLLVSNLCCSLENLYAQNGWCLSIWHIFFVWCMKAQMENWRKNTYNSSDIRRKLENWLLTALYKARLLFFDLWQNLTSKYFS